MAIKTRAQLITDNNTDFPDNVTQLISPEDVRSQMNDTADSALFPEDIEDLDLSDADVTSTGNVTQTLAEWTEDISTAGEFNTVADMLVSTDPALGAGTVWRADGFRYREADPAATDHHLTTAGGVKLYVQQGDDGWYNFLAMGPARDGVTNDADKFKKLLAIRPLGPVAPGSNPWPEGPSIHVPAGTYFMNAGPWGFQVKAVTRIRGESYSPAGWLLGTKFKFPVDCGGFQFNHYDTYEDYIETERPYGTGGTIGSCLERMFLQGVTTATGGNPNAHGVWARTAIIIRDCGIYEFNGNGIHAVGTSSPGSFLVWTSGTDYASGAFIQTDGGHKTYYCTLDPGAVPSTVEPTHTSGAITGADGYGWTYYMDPKNRGGPSHCMFQGVSCVSNRNCGVYIDGGDSNASLGMFMNTSVNGRFGIFDSNFLGNTWIGCHSRGNGLATAGGNPANQTSTVSLQNGPGGTYNKYYAKYILVGGLLDPDMPARLVATMPGTDDNVWVPSTQGGNNVPFHPYYPVWTPGQPVGTFFIGSGYVGDNPNARNIFIGCYAEGDESPGYLSPTSMAMGGIASWQKGSGHIYTTGGIMQSPTGWGVIDDFNNRVTLAGDSNSSATLFRALSYRSQAEALSWIWQYGSTTGDWILQYGGSSTAYNLTSINTTQKMGTSKTQPYLMHFPTFAVGGSTTARRITTGNLKPTTGEWASGDIVWNVSPSIDTYAGWRCTNSGVFGAVAWVTGTNYALNAYILATGGNTYRCSVDPGGSILSTVEPSHGSGEVVGADGFGWTFVSSSAVEFLPFGQTVDLYEHTTTVSLSLSTETHPRQIVHSAVIASSAAIFLPVSAFKGASFRITRTGSGAGVLNIGSPLLKALATNQWCEVVYNGSAWIFAASGSASATDIYSLDALVPASGGTVTQITSKATNVTLDKICGRITTHNASLAASTTVSFTLLSSKIAAADVVHVSIASGVPDGAYDVNIDAIATGSCRISILNRTASPRTDSIVINFVVIKGSTA